MARRALYHDDPLLDRLVDQIPPAIRHFLLKRCMEIAGLVVLAISVGTALALLSYSASDPSFSTATNATPDNLLGLTGARIADLALQLLGAAAVLPVFALTVWAFWLLFAQPDPELWVGQRSRMLAGLAAIFTGSLSLACLPIPAIWPFTVGLGGVLGEGLYGITGAFLASLIGPAANPLIFVPSFALTLFLLCIASGIERRDIIATWLAAAELSRLIQRQALRMRGKEIPEELYALTPQGRAAAGSAALERLEPLFGAPKPEIKADAEAQAPTPAQPDRLERPAPPTDETPAAPRAPVAVKRAARAAAAKAKKAASSGPVALSSGNYELPPLSLLAKPRNSPQAEHVTDDVLQERARELEGVLDDFGVKGEIIGVRPGPVVTLYELEPAPGIKSSRVIGLADDIARSMSAVSARVAVIPGRNVIGIELPNLSREMVFLRDLLSSEAYETTTMQLPLALGKNIGGDPVISDIARMPHLLIAGTTGSGKSVSVNTMILSLLYRLSPDDCKLIMIDPKMLELSVYDGIPHLLTPVVTDPRKAVVALKWVVREMEGRYRKMSKVGVRNIKGYNERIEEARNTGEEIVRRVQTGFDKETGEAVFEEEIVPLETMPFIVVIVDEMADLMMVAGKDIENAVQRLAQMARAAGIHMITATQRPSVDVITGTIKANFPTRISFQVTSKIDSRTILGEMGAEQLLGQGDMLYMAGGGRISRVHAPFVSDAEVEKIVDYLKSQGAPDYIDDITVEPDEGDQSDMLGLFEGSGNSGDDLYDRAVAIVARDRKASTSYVQRKLQIGYNRAARLIERMEDEGVVSSPNHSGKREVLVGDHSAA